MGGSGGIRFNVHGVGAGGQDRRGWGASCWCVYVIQLLMPMWLTDPRPNTQCGLLIQLFELSNSQAGTGQVLVTQKG